MFLDRAAKSSLRSRAMS